MFLWLASSFSWSDIYISFPALGEPFTGAQAWTHCPISRTSCWQEAADPVPHNGVLWGRRPGRSHQEISKRWVSLSLYDYHIYLEWIFNCAWAAAPLCLKAPFWWGNHLENPGTMRRGVKWMSQKERWQIDSTQRPETGQYIPRLSEERQARRLWPGQGAAWDKLCEDIRRHTVLHVSRT